MCHPLEDLPHKCSSLLLWQSLALTDVFKQLTATHPVGKNHLIIAIIQKLNIFNLILSSMPNKCFYTYVSSFSVPFTSEKKNAIFTKILYTHNSRTNMTCCPLSKTRYKEIIFWWLWSFCNTLTSRAMDSSGSPRLEFATRRFRIYFAAYSVRVSFSMHRLTTANCPLKSYMILQFNRQKYNLIQ